MDRPLSFGFSDPGMYWPGPFFRADVTAPDREQGKSNIPPNQVVATGRILLPVDIAKCSFEAFSYVNEFARQRPVSVHLLHVVNLNVISPDNCVFEDLSSAAHKHLEQIAEKFLDARLSIRLRVRIGRPAQEIIAEAKESHVDMILLTSYGGSSRWKRPFRARIVEKVLSAAPCTATLLQVRTRFNCEEDWSCVDDIISSLEYVGLFRRPSATIPALNIPTPNPAVNQP